MTGQLRKLLALLDAGLSWSQSLALMSDSQSLQLARIDAFVMHFGASPKTALTFMIDRQEAQQRWSQRATLAMAGPKATVRLVSWMPVLVLGVAQLLGLNPVGALLTNGFVLAAGLFGVALLVIGQLWMARLLAVASTHVAIDWLEPALLVSGLRAGFDLQFLLTELQLEPTALNSAVSQSILSARDIAEQTGVGIASILEAEIAIHMQTEFSERMQKLERVSVRLMSPLALTTLPAFLLLAVLPLAVALLR
ncbi:MAG: hypothetical protein RLZZ164_1191 [Actinomycetota bacterium]